MRRFFENKSVYRIIIALISLYVLIAFVKLPPINGDEQSMFSDMVYGTAWKPFVYRTLLPTSVRIISEAIPESVQIALTEKIESNHLLMLGLEKLKWESEFITEYLIGMVLMYLSLMGFVYAFRKLFDEIYTSPLWFKNFISVVLLFFNPSNVSAELLKLCL